MSNETHKIPCKHEWAPASTGTYIPFIYSRCSLCGEIELTDSLIEFCEGVDQALYKHTDIINRLENTVIHLEQELTAIKNTTVWGDKKQGMRV